MHPHAPSPPADEIWRELARAKFASWQAASKARATEQAHLKQRLLQLLEQQGAGGGGSGVGSSEREALESVFRLAAQQDVQHEVPSAFTCPLTMEVYR